MLVSTVAQFVGLELILISIVLRFRHRVGEDVGPFYPRFLPEIFFCLGAALILTFSQFGAIAYLQLDSVIVGFYLLSGVAALLIAYHLWNPPTQEG